MILGRFQRWSKLRKLTYAACAFFTLSYICFNILDLDESDLPRKSAPSKHVLLIAEARYEFKLSDAHVDFTSHADPFVPRLTVSSERAPVRELSASIFRDLESLRSHRYRVALPRSAPVDPLPRS